MSIATKRTTSSPQRRDARRTHARDLGLDSALPMPSFLKGMARVLDLGATLDHRMLRDFMDETAFDRAAMRTDWCSVWQDIRDGMVRRRGR